jgi:hypothetical protein
MTVRTIELTVKNNSSKRIGLGLTQEDAVGGLQFSF